MLEQKIQELTDAVMKLTAAILGSGRAVTSTSSQSSAPTESTKTPAPTDKDKDAKKEKAKQEKDEKAKADQAALKPIQEKVQALVKAGKQVEVKAILSAVGATTLPTIPPEHYESVLAQLSKISLVASAPEAPKVTRKEVLEYATPRLQKGVSTDAQTTAVKALVEEFGADRVSKVDEAKLVEFFPKFKAIFETKAEETLV